MTTCAINFFKKTKKYFKKVLTYEMFCDIINPLRKNAPLAQLVEQLTLNQWVRGSSPRRCTKKANRSCQRHDLFAFLSIFFTDSEPVSRRRSNARSKFFVPKYTLACMWVQSSPEVIITRQYLKIFFRNI